MYVMTILLRLSFALVELLIPLSLLLESLWTHDAEDGMDDIVDDPRHDGAGLWSTDSTDWLQLEQSVVEQQQDDELAFSLHDMTSLSSTFRDLYSWVENKSRCFNLQFTPNSPTHTINTQNTISSYK